jgi:hypothetical protein
MSWGDGVLEKQEVGVRKERRGAKARSANCQMGGL